MNRPDPGDRGDEIAIVGAGIAGCTLALACHQAGLAVRLYERLASRIPDEQLLELPPNGARVLHALGLKNALTERAATPSFSVERSLRTGFLLSQRPLGGFSEARYGAPCYLIAADRLQAILDAACTGADIPIEWDTAISDVETESGFLIADDGSRWQHLAVAVASGAPTDPDQPGLANLLESRRWQSAPTWPVIRARGTRTVADRDRGRFISHWTGPGVHITERPLPDTVAPNSEDSNPSLKPSPEPSQDQSLEITAIISDPGGQGSAGERLLASCSASQPGFRAMIETATDAVFFDRLSSPVPSHWYAGRAVMLGSVCHAPPADSILGLAIAMEDAWVLSRMLERWEEAPHEGFADYTRYRKPRAERIRRAQDQQREVLEATGFTRWRLNLGQSLSSRFLPEIAMQKLDWLYGYDCIRGFA